MVAGEEVRSMRTGLSRRRRSGQPERLRRDRRHVGVEIQQHQVIAFEPRLIPNVGADRRRPPSARIVALALVGDEPADRQRRLERHNARFGRCHLTRTGAGDVSEVERPWLRRLICPAKHRTQPRSLTRAIGPDVRHDGQSFRRRIANRRRTRRSTGTSTRGRRNRLVAPDLDRGWPAQSLCSSAASRLRTLSPIVTSICSSGAVRWSISTSRTSATCCGAAALIKSLP